MHSMNSSSTSADEIAYEIEVEEASGTSPTITVRHLHSASGKKYTGLTALVSAQSLSSLPYRDVKTQTGPLAGFGAVGVTLGGSDNLARVKIWATGRSK